MLVRNEWNNGGTKERMTKCLQRANLRGEWLGKNSRKTKDQASWLRWPQARVNIEHNLVIWEHNCMESLVPAPNLWVTCYELGQSTCHSRVHFLHPQRRGLGQVISSSFNILWFFNPILGWKIWSQSKNIFPALTPRPHKFPLYERTQREVHCDHPYGLMSWSFLHSHRPLPKVINCISHSVVLASVRVPSTLGSNQSRNS